MLVGAAAAADEQHRERGQGKVAKRAMERRQAAHNNVARMRKRLVILVLGGLSGLLLAPPAWAAGLSPPVADCNTNGHLTKSYTEAQLSNGLATMPVEVREYSACYDVLRQALLNEIHGLNGGGSGGGGSFLPVWLIVVLALLVLGGAGFGAVAWRNRGKPPESG